MAERSEIHTLRSREETIREAFKIAPERLEELRNLARFIGRDYKMRIELGEPGQGSCFNPEENKIQLDPLHVADPERAYLADFVTAHEGGHRAVTRTGTELGLSRERTEQLYSQLGFGYGFNALEDPAENDWWSRQYEGLQPGLKKTYDEQFSKDAAILGTPEVHRIIQETGTIPRFAHFGSELIRLWHTGGFSEGIPDDVRAALERVRFFARAFFEDIPTDYPNEDEVLRFARDRFTIYQEKIWPEMERLVREDLRDERVRQAVEQGLGGQLPPELREELERMMREAAQAAADEALEEAEARAERMKKDAAAMREAGMEAEASTLEAEAEQALEAGQARAMKFKSGAAPRPVPFSKLSEAMKKALEEAFAKLSKEEKAALEAKARRLLEDIEDAMNKEFASKLDRDAPKSHREAREEKAAALEAERLRQEEAHRKREEAKQIQEAIEGTKSEYDRAYRDVATMVNGLADDLDRLFLPNRQPRWRSGFPTGGRLNLQRAMQTEARPEAHETMWERKSIPRKHDFRFTLMVDLSRSMYGEKIDQAFRAAILTGEALSRIGLQIEIVGFQDELIVFKSFDEPMSETVRKRMSGMPAEVEDGNPGGHNKASYNDDGYCVDAAAKRLAKQPARDRYLVVFSDGIPVPSAEHAGSEWELGNIIKSIRQKREVKMIGIGLGSGTEHVRGYYPASAVVPDVRELPRAMRELFADIVEHPESY